MVLKHTLSIFQATNKKNTERFAERSVT